MVDILGSFILGSNDPQETLIPAGSVTYLDNLVIGISQLHFGVNLGSLNMAKLTPQLQLEDVKTYVNNAFITTNSVIRSRRIKVTTELQEFEAIGIRFKSLIDALYAKNPVLPTATIAMICPFVNFDALQLSGFAVQLPNFSIMTSKTDFTYAECEFELLAHGDELTSLTAVRLSHPSNFNSAAKTIDPHSLFIGNPIVTIGDETVLGIYASTLRLSADEFPIFRGDPPTVINVFADSPSLSFTFDTDNINDTMSKLLTGSLNRKSVSITYRTVSNQELCIYLATAVISLDDGFSSALDWSKARVKITANSKPEVV